MEKDIKKDILFAIPAYSKIMPKYFEKRSSILKRLEALIQEDSSDEKTRFRCCEQLHLDNNKDINWLMKRLANIVAGCINEHNPDFLVNHEAHLLSSWVNIMPGGRGWSHPHTHSQFDWSGIFFAHVEEKENHDPGVLFINPFPHKQKWAKRTQTSYEAKEGMVIVFPSHLTHLFYPHNDKHARLSISFNIKLVPISPTPSIIGKVSRTEN